MESGPVHISGQETRTLVYSEEDFSPEDLLRFVYLEQFDDDWRKMGLTDDQLRGVETLIMARPDWAPVIQGTGGIRKLRFAAKDSKRGKRGGIRVWYLFVPDYSIVFMIQAYRKGERDDLSQADKLAFSKLTKRLNDQLHKGGIT